MKPQLLKDEPVLSEAKKQQLNAVYRFMASNEIVKKSQLQKVFNLDERTVRDYIANIAKRVPVISLSSSNGYIIARQSKDLEKVFHARKELASRRFEIIQREKPQIEFICQQSNSMDSYSALNDLKKDLDLEIKWLQGFKTQVENKLKDF